MKFDSNEIHKQYITTVLIPHFKNGMESTSEFRDIVLRYENSIVVEFNYCDNDPAEDMKIIAKLDQCGNGLVEVPNKYITHMYHAEEIEGIMECIEADQRLLSYAR